MTKKLTFLLALFSAFITFAQHSNPTSLDDLMGWLEIHVNSSKDSTELAIHSRKAILLSEQSNNQNTLAESYRYLAIYMYF